MAYPLPFSAKKNKRPIKAEYQRYQAATVEIKHYIWERYSRTRPIPRNNLENHLKNADFFDVNKFPTSIFQITEIKNFSKDSINLWSNLAIKGITKGIEFIALNNGSNFSSTFTFNRFEWNIAFEGSWADKTLVDKNVELTIEIMME